MNEDQGFFLKRKKGTVFWGFIIMDRDWVFVSVPKQPRHGGSWFIILSWEQKKMSATIDSGKSTTTSSVRGGGKSRPIHKLEIPPSPSQKKNNS